MSPMIRMNSFEPSKTNYRGWERLLGHPVLCNMQVQYRWTYYVQKCKCPLASGINMLSSLHNDNNETHFPTLLSLFPSPSPSPLPFYLSLSFPSHSPLSFSIRLCLSFSPFLSSSFSPLLSLSLSLPFFTSSLILSLSHTHSSGMR